MKNLNKTILENIEKQIVIEKSKFITNLIYVEDMKDAQLKLSKINAKYRDATHNCYAIYINETSQKASDDGEPQGTAGIPMLTVLQQNQIHNCLAVVTRYYGGKKLGAGGLIRAYSTAVSSTLKSAKIGTKKVEVPFELEVDYANLASIKQKLYQLNIKIIQEVYLPNMVIFEILIEQNEIEKVKQIWKINHKEKDV